VVCAFHSRRLRIAALTLLVTAPGMPLQQYRWWYATETRDAQDLEFGGSIMKLSRDLRHVGRPNGLFQVLATLALLAPQVARRDRWREPAYRISAPASVLACAGIFNHQAERASLIVGVTGVVIWYVTSRPELMRTALTLLCVTGFQTLVLFGSRLLMPRDLRALAGPEAESRSRSAAAVRQEPGLRALDTPGSGPPGWDPAMDRSPTRGT